MAALADLDADALDRAIADPTTAPLVVEFYGDRCPSCRVVAALLAELDDELGPGVRFAKVNVDAHPGAADRHRIRGVPTLVRFRADGEERRMPGTPSRAALRAFAATPAP